MSVLDDALALTRHGLRVFPLHTPDGDGCSCGRDCGSVGKHPRTLRGFKDATTDHAKLHEWWRRWPDANVAVATGDTLAVVDVDPRSGGDETLTAFVEGLAGGAAPDTAEVATGGGGRHFYFRAPADLRSGVLGDGLDLKANGGYVVAPPSLHASGRLYSWHPSRPIGHTPLAPVPEWALDAAAHRRGPKATASTEWAKVISGGVPEGGGPHGGRDNTTAALAGHLFAHGLDPYEVLGLLTAWDAQRNRPPLGTKRVTRIAKSIAAREARKLERNTK